MFFAAVAVFLVGLSSAFLSRRALYFVWSSRWWPQVTATVTGRISHNAAQRGLSVHPYTPISAPIREIDVAYTYSVAGKDYESSRHSFATDGWQRVWNNYDEGDCITVYYNPENPAMAVVRSGVVDSLIFIPVVIGVATFLMMLLRQLIEGGAVGAVLAAPAYADG